jgi:hypothetical protein
MKFHSQNLKEKGYLKDKEVEEREISNPSKREVKVWIGFMFRPFPNWPSSGWKTMLEELYTYTGCNRRNGPNFGRVFLMLNYTDITQNTYVQS